MQLIQDTAALAGVLPSRTVKPRTRGYTHMALAAATPDGLIIDEHGEVHTDPIYYIKHALPTAFVTIDPSSFLSTLDNHYRGHPHWRFTLARIVAERGSLSISRVKLTTFGFRACKTPTERAVCPLCCGGLSVRKGRLHQCWDPRAMSPTPVHKLISDASVPSLLHWATDVREWARTQDLELRAALAGYGAQLLRDPRFYPEPRRRVPRATNEHVRPSLPGNLVRLVNTTPGPRTYNVTSIDQRSAGTRIDGIYAAWTSTSTDAGLSRYGSWAQNQIESASRERKQWLKPLLHSTYGLLAARARPLQLGTNHGTAGRSSHFLLGPRSFPVTARELTNFQPAFVNVAQRGMIEAETQLRSLRMAQYLTDADCIVTHIHTDGLHVEGKLPLLPDTWGINGLTDVTYIDNVSWIARERECLPGRDTRERMELVKHHARLLVTGTETQRRINPHR
jgi:hypothetical protein